MQRKLLGRFIVVDQEHFRRTGHLARFSLPPRTLLVQVFQEGEPGAKMRTFCTQILKTNILR